MIERPPLTHPRKIAFTLLAWTLFLLAAEGGLRLVEALRPALPEVTPTELAMCVSDPRRIWRLKADFSQVFETSEFRIAIRTNSWGLRDAPVGPHLPRELRVLVVGDSFSFGWGVEEHERFSEELARLLEQALERPVRVLNAGHWGYSFDQQLLLLEELVPRFHPDLVVQGLYPPHLLTLQAHRWERDASGRLVACANDAIRVAPDGTLRYRANYLSQTPFTSRLVSTLFRIWFRFRVSREAGLDDLPLLDPSSTRFSLGWMMAEKTLGETARTLRERGIVWVAFGIPRDLQVSETEWNDVYRRSVAGIRLDLDLPTRRLGDLVRAEGGHWVDLLPAFRAAGGEPLYLPLDPHWTPAGHRLCARTLAPVLVEELRRVEHGAARE